MLETVLQSNAAAKLGLVLLHFLWQGFAIGALLALGLAALSASAHRARYALAVAAMALLAASPTTTWWTLPASPPAAAVIETSPRTQLPDPAAAENRPDVAALELGATDPVAPSQIASVWERIGTPMPRLSGRITDLAPWLALLWIVGAAALSANLIGGFLSLHRKRLDAATAATELRRLCAALAKQMGINRAVQVKAGSKLDSPCTFGVFRPVILLPVSVATGLPLQRLELILAHELAHIQRHDYLVNVLQTVAETLLFYHPVVWWASRVARREREHICDTIALQATGAKRTEYVETLLSLEEARATLPLAASESPLLERARRILGAPPNSGARSRT